MCVELFIPSLAFITPQFRGPNMARGIKSIQYPSIGLCPKFLGKLKASVRPLPEMQHLALCVKIVVVTDVDFTLAEVLVIYGSPTS